MSDLRIDHAPRRRISGTRSRNDLSSSRSGNIRLDRLETLCAKIKVKVRSFNACDRLANAEAL
jgi:hypothetical protein